MLEEWKHLVRKHTELIKKGDSKIKKYGATNYSEFFAVTTEFFFENPFMIKKRYPDLYGFMVEIFDTDLVQFYKKDMNALLKDKRLSLEDQCPCGSGKVFRACCLLEAN